MSILQGASSYHAYPFCHREERSDVAISFPQQRWIPHDIAAIRSQ